MLIALVSLKSVVVVIAAAVFVVFLLATALFMAISFMPSPMVREFWKWMKNKGFIGRNV